MAEFHELYREWVKGVLLAIPGAGKVHPYQMLLEKWEQFRAAFALEDDAGQPVTDAQGVTLYRGWAIQVIGAPMGGTHPSVAVRTYYAEMRYYCTPHHGERPLADGETAYLGRSELDVWDHIIAAQNALSVARPTFASNINKLHDAQIERRVDYARFGANWAHVATLTQTIDETIRRS